MQLAILLGSALAVGAPGLKEPPKNDCKIEGEWVVESQTSRGRVMKSSIERRYTFTADGEWRMNTVRKGKAAFPVSKVKRTFVLNVKSSPVSIDMRSNANSAQPNMIGIVKVDRDRLTLCYAPNGGDRPRAFESPEGSNIILIVMRRVKKE